MQLTAKNILVIGDAMLDKYTIGTVDQISPEAPVPKMKFQRIEYRVGGAANVAMNILGLGSKVTLACVLGLDTEGAIVSGNLQKAGVSLCICNAHNCRTIVKERIVANNYQIARIDYESVYPSLFFNALGTINHFDAVILSDYAKGTLGEKLCIDVIAKCLYRNIPVLVDPKGKDYTKYSHANVITPNEKEYALVDYDAEYNIENLVITKGDKGIELINRQGRYLSPAKAKEVYDVSGAGDTVIATLTVCMANGIDLHEAVDYANHVAGIVVGKFGTYAIQASDLHQAKLDMHSVRKTWQREKIVFVNGCFDILHPGHLKLLKHAKSLGTKLVVALNTDSWIRSNKHKNPVYSEQERLEIISSLECVDLALLFDSEFELATMLSYIQPDIMVKGKDYIDKDITGRAYCTEIVFVDLYGDYSSSKLVAQCV